MARYKVDIAALSETRFSEQGQLEELRDTVKSTALDVLGHARNQHKDWFDDNDAAINALLVEKNQLHKAYVDSPTAAKKTAFYRSRRIVQQRLREMQDAWMTRKAEEIQGYVDQKEWKNFFAATKAVYGAPIKGPAPPFSAGKIFARILLNRLNAHLEQGLLPESQCGFR
ncbi:unnamed protein product [Schistocephalus solidus]|uniref:Reverse transcriptase domain-containing protein n=1 Tax=Schistocephalus solidus TaxID=70667 RepID=A0A3P7CAD6_SCHSO|nr:unnamed protein product [Schistocephalus solidus]